jgi:hypothetical protein
VVVGDLVRLVVGETVLDGVFVVVGCGVLVLVTDTVGVEVNNSNEDVNLGVV